MPQSGWRGRIGSGVALVVRVPGDRVAFAPTIRKVLIGIAIGLVAALADATERKTACPATGAASSCSISGPRGPARSRCLSELLVSVPNKVGDVPGSAVRFPLCKFGSRRLTFGTASTGPNLCESCAGSAGRMDDGVFQIGALRAPAPSRLRRRQLPPLLTVRPLRRMRSRSCYTSGTCASSNENQSERL